MRFAGRRPRRRARPAKAGRQAALRHNVAQRPKSDEIRRVFAACRDYFLAAGLFALAINLLYLAGPLYMLQVYDRVVSSGSVTTR